MPRTARSGTTTTDHDEIRKWVEERGGSPAAVKRATRGDAGILRIDFPGFSGKNLQPISWDDWFKTFDEQGLAFLHREQDRFNKIVRREPGARPGGGEERAAKGGAKRGAARRTSTSKTGASRGSSRSTGRRAAKGGAAAKAGAAKGGAAAKGGGRTSRRSRTSREGG